MKKQFLMKMYCVFFLSLILLIETASAQESDKILIGYIENFITMSDNESGYGYDYFKKVEEFTSYEFEFVKFDTWEEGASALEDGEIHIFGPSFPVEGNASLTYNNYTFACLGYTSLYLYGTEENNLTYDDILSLQEYSLITQPQIYQSHFIEEYASRHNLLFNYDAHTRLTDPTQSLRQSQLLLSPPLYNEENVKIIDTVGLAPIFYFSTPDHTELMNEINQALLEIHLENPSYAYELYSSYFPENESRAPLLTAAETQAIERQHHIRIGYGTDYFPMQYIDENGIPSGLSVDIVSLVAEKLGITIEFIPFYRNEPMSFLDLDASIAFTEREILRSYSDRALTYFSTPFILIGHSHSNMLLYNSNREECMYNSIIGTMDYANEYSRIWPTQNLNNKVEYYNSDTLLFEAFENNEITHMVETVFTYDTSPLAHYGEGYVVSPLFEMMDYSITFADHLSEDFVLAFGKALDSINMQTHNQLTLKYIHSEHSFFDRFSLPTNRTDDVLMFVLFCFVFLILAIMLFNAIKVRKINKTSMHDTVTGLYSQAIFLEKASKMLENAGTNEYMMVMADIANYDFIVDVYPQEEVDTIMLYFTKHITRLEKTMPNLFATRLEGGKFIILSKYVAFERMEKIIMRVPTLTTNEILGNSIKLDIKIKKNIGFYHIKDPSMSCTQIISRLYELNDSFNKKDFKDNVLLYTEEMDRKRKLFAELSLRMEDALENNEFIPYLLPKVDLKTDKINGAEVLARWNTGEEIIPPDDFIPVFERNGFIYKLDLFMFEECCKFLKSLPNFDNLSLNLSPITLLHSSAQKDFLDIVQKYRVNTKAIRIEVAETSSNKDKEQLDSVLVNLRNAGFSIVIEDFGMEYSSLSLLHKVRADSIKFEKSFIDSLKSPKGRVLLASLLSTLQQLNYKIIAEGIETEAQLNQLKELGCDIGQGYFFTQPLTVEDFAEAYTEGKNDAYKPTFDPK